MTKCIGVWTLGAVCSIFAAILAAQQPALPNRLPAPVRVLASNGVKAALEDLRVPDERALGRPTAIEFDTTASIRLSQCRKLQNTPPATLSGGPVFW